MANTAPENVVWDQIQAYYRNPRELPEADERRVEITGVAHERTAAAEPLLEPKDIAGLVITEKKLILSSRFLTEGTMRERKGDLQVIQRAGVGFALLLHPEILESVGWVPEDWRKSPRAFVRIAGINFEAWLHEECLPALPRITERKRTDPAWGRAFGRGEVEAEDRDTRLTQLHTGLVNEHGNLLSGKDTVRAVERAIEMYEAYMPDVLLSTRRNKGERVQLSIAEGGSWAVTLADSVGFEKVVRVNPGGEIGVSKMQVKDAMAALLVRCHEGKKQPKMLHESQLGDEEQAGFLGEQEAVEGDQEAMVAAAEAREALEALEGDMGLLLDQVLTAIDGFAVSDPETAVLLAARVVRLVALLVSEPDPALRGALLHAWGRGPRGLWSREECASAIGSSVSSIQRRESDARNLLVLNGL
jgi:hypothetical protein